MTDYVQNFGYFANFLDIFSKNEKIVKNYQREDSKKPKISKKISDVRTYGRQTNEYSDDNTPSGVNSAGEKQSKIQKSVRKISSYYIEVPNLSFLASFLMKKSVLARFWENRILYKKTPNLPDSIKISQCFAFEPIKSPNSINNSYTMSYIKKRIWYENENSFKMYLWSCWSTFTMISIPKKSTNYWKTAKWRL